jgi:hypothetical protein
MHRGWMREYQYGAAAGTRCHAHWSPGCVPLSTWYDCGFVDPNLPYKGVWVPLQLLHQHLLPLLCRDNGQAGITHRQVPRWLPLWCCC